MQRAIMDDDHDLRETSSMTPHPYAKKNGVRQTISQWGVFCVVIAIVVTQFRPQLEHYFKELSPIVAWARNKLSGQATPAAGAEPSKKDQLLVVSKLSAVGAKVYGSMHCSWTRRQLEVIGVDVSSDLFVDCDKHPTECAKIQAFPTWSIQGKTEPGYLPLDALSMITDGLLLAAYKGNKTNAQPKPDDEMPSPVEREKILDTIIESVEDVEPVLVVESIEEAKNPQEPEADESVEAEVVDAEGIKTDVTTLVGVPPEPEPEPIAKPEPTPLPLVVEEVDADADAEDAVVLLPQRGRRAGAR